MIAPPTAAEQAPSTGLTRPWRQELSERVEDFRRRRARLRGDADRSTNLEFDFNHEAHRGSDAALDVGVGAGVPGNIDLDVELKRAAPREEGAPVLDSLAVDRPGETVGSLTSPAVDATDLLLEPGSLPPQTVEIVMDWEPPPESPQAEAEAAVLPRASMGRRFLAGLVDALVLAAAAGIFALIFWRAGGRLSAQPLNLVVVGFIAAFFITTYFGVFTALTSTTPGLLWLGIEVRAADGTYPTITQAFWRAFGYLVSIGALMLGFVWALVDSDGLTWHDRMSGTFLAAAEGEVESRLSDVES
jgi:uncharacterized RDD family membrane protein YckC